MFGCRECRWHHGYRWQCCCCHTYTGSAGWFFGSLAAVLGFALLVMLAVVTGCESQVVTDPGVGGVTTPIVAGDCAPFCGMVNDGAGIRGTS